MTNRERVIRTLRHQESDIVPYSVDFTGQEWEKMVAYTGDPQFYSKIGGHMHCTQYCGWPTEIPGKPQYFRDEYGVVWNRSGADKDIGVVDSPLIPDLEARDYVMPPLDEERLRKEYEALIYWKSDNFVVGGIGFTMFERAWSLCGMENTLADMLCCPKELEQLLEDITQRNLRILDIALEYEVDGIYFGDDWGQQKGLIMGPEHWRHFIKPCMKRLYGRVKQAGKFVLQHSCGDIQEIFPDLIDIGLDCYQTFQPEIYNIEKVKREFGGDLTFWGGISTQQLLPKATPEVVRSETIRIMNIMRRNGGYIAAPTHSVPSDVPPENIEAMLDVFMHQDRYL